MAAQRTSFLHSRPLPFPADTDTELRNAYRCPTESRPPSGPGNTDSRQRNPNASYFQATGPPCPHSPAAPTGASIVHFDVF